LGTEDQMDQMFYKHTRAYVRIYVEKNWSVGPTGPLHSCTAAQLFLRLTHARVHIIILEFNWAAE
jgi:hypothetical protein